ncbi:MAG: UTP--glucose-1-phosphate uridylyltransferase [Phycisphaerales bacterium]
MTLMEQTAARLERVGQSHLLKFAGGLSPGAREAFVQQVAALDLEALPALIDAYVLKKPKFELPDSVAPAPYYAHDGRSINGHWDRDRFRHEGELLIRAGKVAAFVVAGGQGSRLGFEGPKGCFRAGVLSDKSLFQLFAEQLLGAKRRYGVAVPWYVMTSPLNHAATVAFFEQHDFFGLSRNDVMFFPQGVMPSLDIMSGKVLLASKSEVATNPDGHGGAVRALATSGALSDMKARGIEHVSYFQVDNPHVRILDPVFIGLHAAAPDSSAEMSSKMIPKVSPEEKVGVFCTVNGRVEVIEYSDLPADLQKQRLEDGTLRFIAGSIAIHIMAVEFLERLASDPRFALPYHRAEKKVPCIDPATGEPVAPTANNGVKLERFVFDALSMCKGSIVYETDRVEEFAPIKNASGVDSVESCKLLQTERAARWLESRGVRIARRADGTSDCVIEISPLTATEASEIPAAVIPASVGASAKLSL